MPNDAPVRVLVVDDHTLFRKALANLLGKQREFEVAGEAANGREALRKARELTPDIILMDLFMPEMDGLETTRRILRENPRVPIVILTVSDDNQSLAEAIESGAQGYLRKNIEPQALFSTMRQVSRGEAPLPRVMNGPS